MLPPVDESVLQSNPEFSVLYSKLANDILNPDGSTRKDPAAEERRSVTEVRRDIGYIHYLQFGPQSSHMLIIVASARN
jgi:hypothetical protein